MADYTENTVIICIIMGFFLVNDMHNPPPSSKRAVSIFWSKLLRNILKLIKNQFSDF